MNAKNEVEYRPVKIGQAIQDLRVIFPPDQGQEGKEGLTEGELIVVSGMQRVRNGVAVDAETRAPPKPPAMSLVRLLGLPTSATKPR